MAKIIGKIVTSTIVQNMGVYTCFGCFPFVKKSGGDDSSSAVLGKAVLGRMVLGKN